MLRLTHRWPGLVAGLVVLVLALSGAALSVFPAIERAGAPQAASALSVAELTTRVQQSHPGLEQIRRAASGRLVAYWFDAGTPGAAVIDPATGQDAGSADPSAVELWFTNLHRSLFLDDAGRIVAAVAAAALLVLALSGAALVARRMGGWRRWFGRTRGPWAGRLHVELARFAVGGLLLSSLTGLWMTASVFSLVPDIAVKPAPATATAGLPHLSPEQIALFSQTPVADMTELTFPYPDDPADVYTLKTAGGTALVDPGTGQVLSSAARGAWERTTEIMVMLHTGQGAAVLGLILGLMVLTVPALALTGWVQWLSARRSGIRIKGNVAAARAETILLVASEGGSTWGFARTLRDALTAAGHSVHAAPIGQFDPVRYSHARRIIILAATYGMGEAPTSARGVLDRIRNLPRPPLASLAVLGFGDRSFPDFCAYADNLAQAARAIGWAELAPVATVDRQSPQDFARWGRDLGAALGIELELSHLPEAPRCETLRLVQRRDYGAEVQAPTAILRFALPARSLWSRLTRQGFARFQAGDVLGILPAGSDVPRFYSLASSARDGFVEICVRKLPGGLCSGQLTGLAPGATVAAFLRRNPEFRPAKGRAPVILIGAGTGIGPLAGFLRANHIQRPMHLFFGARTPTSDLLYDEELKEWATGGRLTTLTTAFSRHGRQAYVQDRLREDAGRIGRLLSEGAQIMVCGGREMAHAVREVLGDILATTGQSPATLKAEGRYAEDIYFDLSRQVLNGPTMGTRWSVVLYAAAGFDLVSLQADLQAAADEIDVQMSTWKPQSDLMRLNAAPVGEWVTLPERLLTVLGKSLEIGRISGGAFEIAMGDAITAWGFGPATADPQAIRAARFRQRRPSFETLALDLAGRAALKEAEMTLDLSGIAKGYGVDRLAELLQRRGIAHALAAIDGELRAIGGQPDGRGWAVAVERPDPETRTPHSMLEVRDIAIASSGDYRHWVMVGERRLSHTMNPTTGAPLLCGPAAVTVLAGTCIEADALASAFMVLGEDQGTTLARKLGIDALFLKDSDRTAAAFSDF